MYFIRTYPLTSLEISDELNRDTNNGLCKTVKDQLAKLGEEVEAAKKNEPVIRSSNLTISRMSPKPESKLSITRL